ncbi:J domain-containing protein [Kovacikia minuta CCNUW1]|uniref:J domain-containing protein n=1 Tax=Kovacikia minuta TaxID=2931930 RepID=UPI001CCB5E2A|nr:J domain-containing protein [Kovacikia minuta]UBF26988.1 J domain-containing protein [Kovacikia minuta CCNUW1]
MRIPLDYYRILGLPIQATAEQLRQAHRDRALQLPRREYSDAAIASRKKLLDEAYAVLSNPEQRKTYDSGFLAKTYELVPGAEASPAEPLPLEAPRDAGADPHTPNIEIQDDQFIGALLILQDLGEYELVLKLGRPYLTNGSASVKGGQFGEPNIVFSDIVLTVALACLELGREQWQQGQYENASEALETGQQLLLREGLFAGVRGEIQNDLYKLRPYRVLELLALPEQHTEERYRGMQLLQEMLQERDGIDGTGDDQSGLNIDDFLRFIQQLRGYLTAAEQQVLFEQEAQRPSAVATYLAVYALLARGFAERQPVLVRRAKLLLMRLSNRQDVHLEQAVCALFLGQTEEASHALELSQEFGPIAFIREHSQGSPDLLPGLCLYAERWLQDEVFPHFRDLSRQQASLRDYFARSPGAVLPGRVTQRTWCRQ